MLIGAEQLIYLAESYRLVWVLGRFGGGKTSFGVALSAALLDKDNKRRLLTNCRVVFADPMEQVVLQPDGMLHAVTMLDEGGLYFKVGHQVEQIAAYARKMDLVVIIPSFWPPARAAQVLTVQPVWSFRSVGIPLICYRWSVRMGSFRDGGNFFWLFPQGVYGVYSTQDPGADCGEVVSHLGEQVERYVALHGRKKQGSRNTVKISLVEETGGEVERMAELADTIQQTAEDASSVLQRASKLSRRR